jgi:thiamine biosynthesis protein ThiS
MQTAKVNGLPTIALAATSSYLRHVMGVTASLSIRINGEPRLVSGGASNAAMLAELGIDPKRVAVERNREIVPRSTLGDVPVTDGDAFEIVHFVGGG